MSGESASIRATVAPATRASLAADLARLGVRPGGVLLVHSSLVALGWVCGGAPAVVLALLDTLGPDGTLVVPTHSNGNSEPSEWENPPVPEDWWPVVREHMPAYDARVTPTLLGAIPELARCWPGARRSDHPHFSFAAVGPQAEAITAGHPLEDGLGEASPLARVHDLDGDVLLLGVGHDANTSLHLAEYRLPGPPRKSYSAAVATPAGRRWVTWEDITLDESDFGALGAAFDATGRTRTGRVGVGEARLMHQRDAVAFAAGWLAEHRPVGR
jgi:aminoglycoside 3-N-acetyltransferase